jgi:polar amino acid transport system substrate-binding protein
MIGLLALLPVAQAGMGLTLVGDAWPPYVDRNLPEQGMASEIVVTALKRAGYEPKVQVENWMRVLEGSEIGIYDGIVAAWHTPERAEKFLFSDPYYVNTIKLVKRKDADFSFRRIFQEQGLVVGYVEGYAYNEKLKKPQNLILVPSNHVIQNLMKLQQGQIDLTLADEGVLKYQLASYFSNKKDQFELDSQAFSERPLHFMVSKLNPRHAKIIQAFNQSLAEMKKDGSYEKIVDRHLK